MKRIALLLLLVLALSACNKTVYVEKYIEKIDTVTTVLPTDTITITRTVDCNSVFGDTIETAEQRVEVVYRDRILRVKSECKPDTVKVFVKGKEIAIEKTVEKKVVPRWCFICVGVTLLVILLILKRVTSWLVRF